LYHSGQLTARLQFEGEVLYQGVAYSRQVILIDRSGKELGRWLLVSAEDPQPVPSLEQSWPTFERLNYGPHGDRLDSEFALALSLVESGQWDKAYQRVAELLHKRPNQPLLAYLSICCLEQNPNLDNPERMQHHLRTLGSSGCLELCRALAGPDFRSFTSRQLYDALAAQPDERRTTADLLLLAEVALAANLPHDAIRLASDPRLPRSARSGFKWDHVRLDAFLRLGEFHSAKEEALRNSERTPADIEILSELLRAKDLQHVADQLCGAALARQLTQAQRAELLLTRATLHTGWTRWRYLLDALRFLDEQRRREKLAQLLSELQTETDATTLFEIAMDGAVRQALQLRQVELTGDATVAAQRLADLLAGNTLPEHRIDWACRVLLAGGQSERLARFLEDRLRRDQPLTIQQRSSLAEAYQSLQRPHDADRTASTLHSSPKPPRRR
jgi:hypothetical protein